MSSAPAAAVDRVAGAMTAICSRAMPVMIQLFLQANIRFVKFSIMSGMAQFAERLRLHIGSVTAYR
jgi:hypothetical protein